MSQGLGLVDLRSRSMAQSCMPPVRIRRTAAGVPHRQELVHSQKAASRIQELRRWDDPGRVDASRPEEGGGTWSRLASLPGLGENSRLLLSEWVARARRWIRLGELFQRNDVPVTAYSIYQFP